MAIAAALLHTSLAMSGSGCASPTSDEIASIETAVRNGNATPTTTTPQHPHLPTSCPEGNVKFDGSCRHVDFFERFVSTGGSLIGVSGPPSIDSDDTGVVVLEATSANSYNQLYILPEHSPIVGGSGGFVAFKRGYEYRANYPVIFKHLVTSWQDDAGYLNVFSEYRAPGMTGLTPTGWSHYVTTLSGYEIMDSENGHTVVAASGGSGDYCDLAASGAGWAVGAACSVPLLGTAAYSAAIVGVGSAATVFVVGTGSTLGIGTGPAALAGAAAGATLASGWFGAYAATGARLVCGPLGELVDEAVDTLLCNGTPGPEDPEFLPVIPAQPVFPNDWGFCPSGMALYTGEVMQCTSQNGVTTLDDGTEVESVEVLCIRNYVHNQCAYI